MFTVLFTIRESDRPTTTAPFIQPPSVRFVMRARRWLAGFVAKCAVRGRGWGGEEAAWGGEACLRYPFPFFRTIHVSFLSTARGLKKVGVQDLNRRRRDSSSLPRSSSRDKACSIFFSRKSVLMVHGGTSELWNLS